MICVALCTIATCSVSNDPSYMIPKPDMNIMIEPETPVTFMVHKIVKGDTIYSRRYYAKENEMAMAMYATRLSIWYKYLDPIGQNEYLRVKSYVHPLRIHPPDYVVQALLAYNQ